MHFQKSLFIGCVLAFLYHHSFAQNEHESLGGMVNSFVNEENPILSDDGNTLYFTRKFHPENMGGKKDAGDIWFSTLQADGSWSEAKNAGTPLNNAFANSIIGFAKNGQTVFLHGHYPGNRETVNTQGVSVSRREGNSWNKPEPLKIPYFYSKSDHLSGSLYASGNIMVVSLQSYDTRGAEDLYVLFRQNDGTWSEPKNLGKDINTEYQEMTPFLAPDGKTLFFASNGYEGFGSRDIFMSVRLDDTWKRWSNPKNLGAAVNTEGTELFYFLPSDGDFAYLTSTQNSDGLGDVVKVRIKPEVLQVQQQEEDTLAMVKVEEEVEEEEEEVIEEKEEVTAPEARDVKVQGTIMNKESGQPVQANVFYRILQEDTAQFSRSVQANAQGEFSLSLIPDKDYELMVSAEGFIKEKEKVLLSAGEEDALLEREILLTPIEVGATVNLENVLFDRGTADMLPGSTETLDDVVELLKENPGVSIEVSGHTDNQGRPDLNMLLSKDRAKAVKDYLVSQGIKPERIQDKGYGGSKPIASNAIEEERKKNRRVEFTIIEK